MIDTNDQPRARSAVISPDGKYRYHLWRKLSDHPRVATFIMLNPSTADAHTDDPTIRKCLGFTRRWSCGELQVVNLFALRTKSPASLRRAPDPTGPENLDWLQRTLKLGANQPNPARRGPVICAWGTHCRKIGQVETVLRLIKGICQPMCLGVTRDGHPRHPLYVPYRAELVAFEVPSANDVASSTPRVRPRKFVKTTRQQMLDKTPSSTARKACSAQ